MELPEPVAWMLRNCPEIISTFPRALPATRYPLPAKAQTDWPLRAAGSVLKCGNYLKTTAKGDSQVAIITRDQKKTEKRGRKKDIQ